MALHLDDSRGTNAGGTNDAERVNVRELWRRVNA
jgi:hypothetical protein